MLDIREQRKIQTLEKAWLNCGILSTATTGHIDCLPISDVRNVENIDYAFAVDEDFEGKTSYIDTVATLETVDPVVIYTAEGTFENNRFEGTCTGANNQEHKVELMTMFADNVDLTVDGIPSNEKNGIDIFEKLNDIVDSIGYRDPDSVFLKHTHDEYNPYLDGHTKCFTKNQGKLNIGDGNVFAIRTIVDTNQFNFKDPSETKNLLQTEVAFTVTKPGPFKNVTQTILCKTINLNETQQTSSGDTQTVKVDQNGNLLGKVVGSNVITFDWTGTPCTKTDLVLQGSDGNNVIRFPNNMHFRICHKVTVLEGTILQIRPGAKIGIDAGGSIVIQKRAIVNVLELGKILIEGQIENNGTIYNDGTVTIDPRNDSNNGKIANNGTINNKDDGKIENKGTLNNNGTINNDGTIATVTGGITGNEVKGNTPDTI